MNRVTLLGRLGKDPELKRTQSNNVVCTLSLATTERSTNNGEPKEATEWHRITVWGKRAENCAKYLAKGREVLVEGKLQTRQWNDREGQKRYTTEIVASYIEFIGRKDDGNSDNPQANGGGYPQREQGPNLDEIPF